MNESTVKWFMVLTLIMDPSAGEFPPQWSPWSPWLCLCDVRRAVRFRHYPATEYINTIPNALEQTGMWEEQPCPSIHCNLCPPGFCPENIQKTSWRSASPVQRASIPMTRLHPITPNQRHSGGLAYLSSYKDSQKPRFFSTSFPASHAPQLIPKHQGTHFSSNRFFRHPPHQKSKYDFTSFHHPQLKSPKSSIFSAGWSMSNRVHHQTNSQGSRLNQSLRQNIPQQQNNWRPAESGFRGPAKPAFWRPTRPASQGPAEPAFRGPAFWRPTEPASRGPARPASRGPDEPTSQGPASRGPAEPASRRPNYLTSQLEDTWNPEIALERHNQGDDFEDIPVVDYAV